MDYKDRYYNVLRDWFNQSTAGDFDEFIEICNARMDAAFDRLMYSWPCSLDWDKAQNRFVLDEAAVIRHIKDNCEVDYLDFLIFVSSNGGDNDAEVAAALDEAIFDAVREFVEDNEEEFLVEDEDEDEDE